MARPERHTVDYFPHLIGEGKKIFSIENKYGNDGYATWFKILEKLATTKYHFLNLNDEGELMYMAAKCHVQEDRLIAIITDLSRLNVFDKNLWEVRIIWCQAFIDSIQDAYFRRNNKCIQLDGLCKHLLSLGIQLPNKCSQSSRNNTQTKVNYSKVKKTKEENSEFDVAFEEFIEMRKRIKKPPTERALELVRKELIKLAPENEKLQIEIINQSIRNSWQDVFPLRNGTTIPQQSKKEEPENTWRVPQ